MIEPEKITAIFDENSQRSSHSSVVDDIMIIDDCRIDAASKQMVSSNEGQLSKEVEAKKEINSIENGSHLNNKVRKLWRQDHNADSENKDLSQYNVDRPAIIRLATFSNEENIDDDDI